MDQRQQQQQREEDSEVEEQLTQVLEDYERAQDNVHALKSFVRKGEEEVQTESEDDEEEDEEEQDAEQKEEEVAEEQKWTKEKAEALEKTQKVEAEYASGEKTMGSLVKGVKQYQEHAHETVKEKEYGQRKWKGMFETEAQRQRGIDLETSLGEIEAYSKNGQVPTNVNYPKKKKAGVGVSAVRTKLEENFRKDKNEGINPGDARGPNARARRTQGGQRGQASGQGQSQQPTNGNGTGQGNGANGTQQTNEHERRPIEANTTNEVKNFANKLTAGGNQGSRFFKEFQKKEKKKYRPSYGMKTYYDN